jgi:hypothetical protein
MSETMTELRTPLLANEHIEMRPFNAADDYEYFYGLVQVYRYNTSTEMDFKHVLKLYMRFGWVIYSAGERVGVCFIAYHPRVGYTLDGYRDDVATQRIGSKVSFVVEAGRLARDWFFANVSDVIRTTHDVRNRAGTILALKLGFKRMGELMYQGERFIVMEARSA